MTETKGRIHECGDGWSELIAELTAVLDGLLGPENWKPAQIKEKFGLLRFYTDMEDGLTEEQVALAWNVTHKYEDVSSHICEDCGAGQAETRCWSWQGRTHGWIRTLCPLHGAKAILESRVQYDDMQAAKAAREAEQQ